jgi:uncharacterized protein YndB with AHSA1/START domain
MRALAILLGLSFAGWAGVAVPARVPDRPDVTDASTVEANGDRILRESILIAASREVVWTAFTTADGLRGWEAPVAAVDLRVGGVMESSYNPKAQLGDANNIKNEILGFLPIELLILRNVQAPSGFKYRDEFARVTTIIQFQDVDARHTQQAPRSARSTTSSAPATPTSWRRSRPTWKAPLGPANSVANGSEAGTNGAGR